MDYVVIDVLEPRDYKRSHVKGAINVPPSSLMSGAPELKDIPKDAKIIVYCYTGSRSNIAMHLMKDWGYKDVTNGINQAQVEAKYGL